jgi:hypothetical protein
MTQRPPAQFVGVTTYRDPLGRFSIRYPTNWRQAKLEDRDGILFAPPAEDPHTWFAAWVVPLEHSVKAADLYDLVLGAGEGLAQFVDCTIYASSELALGNLIRLERVFTFRDGSAVRKRKTWIIYADTWMIVLVWQGSSEGAYEHWLPMANYSFATFHLPEALLFLADPEVPKPEATCERSVEAGDSPAPGRAPQAEP